MLSGWFRINGACFPAKKLTKCHCLCQKEKHNVRSVKPENKIVKNNKQTRKYQK